MRQLEDRQEITGFVESVKNTSKNMDFNCSVCGREVNDSFNICEGCELPVCLRCTINRNSSLCNECYAEMVTESSR